MDRTARNRVKTVFDQKLTNTNINIVYIYKKKSIHNW
jgi:hypothetical protein